MSLPLDPQQGELKGISQAVNEFQEIKSKSRRETWNNGCEQETLIWIQREFGSEIYYFSN